MTHLPDGNQLAAQLHVIVRDRQNGVWRTPQSPSGEAQNGDSREPVVSGNGRAVVFTSHATNLRPTTDANGKLPDIYVWRLDHSTIARVSVDTDGLQPTIGGSYSPSISRERGTHCVRLDGSARFGRPQQRPRCVSAGRRSRCDVARQPGHRLETVRRRQPLAGSERRSSLRGVRVRGRQTRATRSQPG